MQTTIRRFKFFWLIFPVFILLSVVTLSISTWNAYQSLKHINEAKTRDQLELAAKQFQYQIKHSSNIDLITESIGKETGIRFTVIDSSGLVLGDSEEDPAKMSNHANRAEIAQAIKSGKAASEIRYSATLGKHMMYLAILLPESSFGPLVIRSSLPLVEISQYTSTVTQKIIWIAIISALSSILLSWLISQRVSSPIEKLTQRAKDISAGDLTQRDESFRSKEFQSLSLSMDQMAAQLKSQIQTLKTQSAEVETIFASMTDGIFALDMEGYIKKTNAAAPELLALPKDISKQKVLLTDLIRNTKFEKMLHEIHSSEEPVHTDLELSRTEIPRLLECWGSKLLDFNNNPIGSVLIFKDVTKVRQIKNLQRDFVANVSHELRTPVTSIRGFVETLESGAKENPEQLDRFLGIIQRQTERLTAIIEDLLALSRLEKNETLETLEKDETPLQSIVQNAIHSCAYASQKKNISIDFAKESNKSVNVNVSLLEQALVNLISNAIKYSPEGTDVKIICKEVDADQIRVDIVDQGPGIAPKHQERIFERFYRIDKARSREMGGTGLGLAIVKHIARIHGGNVTVKSTLGQGSTFSLHLPT